MNVFADDWDAEQSQPGFTWKRMRLGQRLGGELLGASVFELPPGERSFPYHLHHGNEELLLVLEGTPTLRTPEGERELATGDAVLFRRGPEGAHQVINRSDRPVRFLMVSTMVVPEVAQYPDSGKIGLLAGAVLSGAAPPALRAFFPGDAAVDYFENEPTER